MKGNRHWSPAIVSHWAAGLGEKWEVRGEKCLKELLSQYLPSVLSHHSQAEAREEEDNWDQHPAEIQCRC